MGNPATEALVVFGQLLVALHALLSHPDGPPLRSALPVKATSGNKGGATGKAGAAELQALKQRLDRLATSGILPPM